MRRKRKNALTRLGGLVLWLVVASVAAGTEWFFTWLSVTACGIVGWATIQQTRNIRELRRTVRHNEDVLASVAMFAEHIAREIAEHGVVCVPVEPPSKN